VSCTYLGVRIRNLGLFGAFLLALLPRPAQAQGDFIKNNLKHLIEKTGVYVSATTRTSLDDEVNMGMSIGVGLGFASEHQRAGRKYPLGFSTYSGDLETTSGQDFGRISAKQIMTGVGYQWAHGKLTWGGQIGVGYSFNSVTLDPGVAVAFGVPEPVAVSVSNSFVLRPQAKVEYFVHPKMSLRTQFSFTYTDPDVVIHTVTQDFAHQWNTNHWQLSFAVGFFPLRK
jgi:hypothetical protein